VSGEAIEPLVKTGKVLLLGGCVQGVLAQLNKQGWVIFNHQATPTSTGNNNRRLNLKPSINITLDFN
jgi:hypothetical protein